MKVGVSYKYKDKSSLLCFIPETAFEKALLQELGHEVESLEPLYMNTNGFEFKINWRKEQGGS